MNDRITNFNFRNSVKLVKGLEEITNGYVYPNEPIGFINQLKDKTFEVISFPTQNFGELVSQGMINSSPHPWHGHPKATFEYDKSDPIIAGLEDGNNDKPSIDDIIFSLLNLDKTSTIVLPSGIVLISVDPKSKELCKDISERVKNAITSEKYGGGQYTTQYRAYAEILALLQNGKIDNYTSQNYIKAISTLGLKSEFVPIESILIGRPIKKVNNIEENVINSQKTAIILGIIHEMVDDLLASGGKKVSPK